MNESLSAENANFEAFKSHVVTKLKEAAAEGMASSRLVEGGGRASSEKKRMLDAMVATGLLASERRGVTTKYWLPGLKPPQIIPEEKADEILRKVLPEQRPGQLHTAATIADLLAGHGIKEDAMKTCVRLLVQERLLIPLSAGTKIFYAYAPGLRSLLRNGETGPAAASASTIAPILAAEVSPVAARPEPAPWTTLPPASPAPAVVTPFSMPWTASPTPPMPPPAPTSSAAPQPLTPTSESAPQRLSSEMVIEAYQKIRQQRRLPDVEISKLHEALREPPMDEFKRLVVQLCEKGTFVPGKGDWSFATLANRAAAVLIHDVPHIFVRLKE